MLSVKARAEIDRNIAKYPADQKQSAVMAALVVAQDEYGWVSPEAIEEVAQILEILNKTSDEKSSILKDLYFVDPKNPYKALKAQSANASQNQNGTLAKNPGKPSDPSDQGSADGTPET